MADPGRPVVLLTGATGFVGSHLAPALDAAGWAVRCTSRDPERARARDPQREWVRLDLDDPLSLEPALAGCAAAVYLVHAMGGQGGAADGGDYPQRERREALAFREAAERAGVRRAVYLGGVAPQGEPSRHLQSRLDTGETLRGGKLDVVELRAAMVIGAGSASWLITRDLARRLPVMLLPAWLGNHSWPVAIDDVVAGILLALRPGSVLRGWYDLPGPERISHRALLARVAGHMGRRPLMLGVPVVTPRLSSYWISLVTRAEPHLSSELVEGLSSDLDPRGVSLWSLAPPGLAPTPLDEAIRNALADEARNERPSDPTLSRLLARAGLLALPRPAPAPGR